jgi:hypothetical protein
MNSLEHEVILDRLAHALWAPRDQRYLLSIAQRLLEASSAEPRILDLLRLTADDLRSLPQLIAQAALVSPDAHARLQHVAQDPVSWAESRHGGHPLAGIMDLMPGYTIALTKFPTSSELHDEFEQLITQVLITNIEQNLSRDFKDYKQSATKLLLRELNARQALAKDDFPPNTHNYHQLSLAARKCVSRLALKNKADWDDRDRQTWNRFIASAERFLAKPDRSPRNIQRSSRKQQRRVAPVIYRSKSSATHIRSPLQLLELEYVDPVDPCPELIIKRKRINIKQARKALNLDLSPYEIVQENSFDVGAETHKFHISASVKIAGRFQKKQLSNAAQLLTWSTANLTPSTTEALINQLSDASQEVSSRGLAACFLMASLALGRPLEELSPIGLTLDVHVSSVDAIPEDEFAVAVVLPKLRAIAIRVNQAQVKMKHDWLGTVPISPYVLVPDYFDLGGLLVCFGDAVRSPGSPPSRQIKNTINAPLTQLTKQLATKGVSTSKIWQALPRKMQSESGMATVMAMLTGWQTQNSKVELHYHTVPAQMLASRYMAAMTELVGDYENKFAQLESLLPEQKIYVGAHNCPADAETRNLVKGFKKAMGRHRHDISKSHNLLTLYTLFVCTAGFGLRHAVDPDFEVNRHGSLSWLSYVEKGQHRQLKLPDLVDQQLQLYEEHIHKMKSRRLVKTLAGKHKFFLLDEASATKFRLPSPGRIGQELKAYGIDFPLPLNSYRRWMFSKLFEAGQRGIGTDFFGGHGVAGRLPMTETNSTTLDVYNELAATLDRILTQAGWEPLS